MKKTFIGFITFLTVISFASPVSAKNRKKEVEKCSKQATPLEISGRFTDWQLPMRVDKSTGYYYGITNDNQNLYVEVKMKSRGLISRAIALGFNVWIDPNAKGKDVLGINYPRSRAKEFMHRKPEKNKEQDQNKHPHQLTHQEIEKMRKKMIEKFNLRYLTGQEEGKLINFNKEGLKDAYFGNGDINAIVQMNDKGEVIYEAVIPLKSVFKNPASYVSKRKPFSLILETGSYQPSVTASRMYDGIAGGENYRQMEAERYGGGGEIGQGVNGEGYRMNSQYGGGFQGRLNGVRMRLKRVVLYQYK